MYQFRVVWKKVGSEAPKLKPEPLRRLLSYDRHTDSFPVSEFSERPKASSRQVNQRANTTESFFPGAYSIIFLTIDSQGFDGRIPHQTSVLLQVSTRWSSSQRPPFICSSDLRWQIHISDCESNYNFYDDYYHHNFLFTYSSFVDYSNKKRPNWISKFQLFKQIQVNLNS